MKRCFDTRQWARAVGVLQNLKDGGRIPPRKTFPKTHEKDPVWVTKRNVWEKVEAIYYEPDVVKACADVYEEICKMSVPRQMRHPDLERRSRPNESEEIAYHPELLHHIVKAVKTACVKYSKLPRTKLSTKAYHLHGNGVSDLIWLLVRARQHLDGTQRELQTVICEGIVFCVGYSTHNANIITKPVGSMLRDVTERDFPDFLRILMSQLAGYEALSPADIPRRLQKNTESLLSTWLFTRYDTIHNVISQNTPFLVAMYFLVTSHLVGTTQKSHGGAEGRFASLHGPIEHHETLNAYLRVLVSVRYTRKAGKAAKSSILKWAKVNYKKFPRDCPLHASTMVLLLKLLTTRMEIGVHGGRFAEKLLSMNPRDVTAVLLDDLLGYLEGFKSGLLDFDVKLRVVSLVMFWMCKTGTTASHSHDLLMLKSQILLQLVSLAWFVPYTDGTMSILRNFLSAVPEGELGHILSKKQVEGPWMRQLLLGAEILNVELNITHQTTAENCVWEVTSVVLKKWNEIGNKTDIPTAWLDTACREILESIRSSHEAGYLVEAVQAKTLAEIMQIIVFIKPPRLASAIRLLTSSNLHEHLNPSELLMVIAGSFCLGVDDVGKHLREMMVKKGGGFHGEIVAWVLPGVVRGWRKLGIDRETIQQWVLRVLGGIDVELVNGFDMAVITACCHRLAEWTYREGDKEWVGDLTEAVVGFVTHPVNRSWRHHPSLVVNVFTFLTTPGTGTLLPPRRTPHHPAIFTPQTISSLSSTDTARLFSFIRHGFYVEDVESNTYCLEEDPFNVLIKSIETTPPVNRHRYQSPTPVEVGDSDSGSGSVSDHLKGFFE